MLVLVDTVVIADYPGGVFINREVSIDERIHSTSIIEHLIVYQNLVWELGILASSHRSHNFYNRKAMKVQKTKHWLNCLKKQDQLQQQ